MKFNFKGIIRTISAIVVIFGLSMIVPALISLYYGEIKTTYAFLITLAVALPIAIALHRFTPEPNKKLGIRDGYFIVSITWIVFSLIGAVPFLLSGTFESVADAFFETASGLTTTGASVSTNVEAMPKGILFWRGFLHWIGGMGVLILAIAILPAIGIQGCSIAQAETPAPTLERLTPKLTDMAKILYLTYIGFTILQTILLMFGGLNLLDSVVHSMASVSTGGFANYNTSVAYFGSAYVEMILTIFMVAGGVNFSLYYKAYRTGYKSILKDTEFRFYISVLLGASLLIAMNLISSKMVSGPVQAIREALFQVVAITTTTGFSSVDFDLWPTTSKMILMLLMFFGGCASSTSGSMKMIRILVIIKLIKRGIALRLHPNAVVSVKVGDRTLPAEQVSAIANFSFLYLAIFAFGSLIVSLDNFDLPTSVSAVASCLGNVGPGFNLVGPTMNYSIFSEPIKVFLSFIMLAGRLELFTIVMLFIPSFWNPDR